MPSENVYEKEKLLYDTAHRFMDILWVRLLTSSIVASGAALIIADSKSIPEQNRKGDHFEENEKGKRRGRILGGRRRWKTP
ncbi:hypothetical protein V1478_014311 [Vespula squamosa]|uniref:Uncharacterized protein n=1 Tax=Vespula squamosa TaxID=30214 RepID=A0ABD2AA17_VESSQ